MDTLLEAKVPFLFFRSYAPVSSLWAENFGPYRWFTCPLLSHFVSRSGLTRSNINKHKDRVRSLVPDDLIQFLPWGDWDSISTLQIRQVLSGQLVRLDKAIQVIYIIHHLMFEGEGDDKPLTVLHNLGIEGYIHPACFVLRNRDISERDISDALLEAELFEHSEDAHNAAREIFAGYGVTQFLAEYTNAHFRLLESRTDTITGYMTRPALHPFGHTSRIELMFRYLEFEY